jgi:RHS repeat-associated protein
MKPHAHPVFLSLLLIGLGLLLASPPLAAACSCTVAGAGGQLTLDVSGTSSGACAGSNTRIFFLVDGGIDGGRQCGSVASCSHSYTRSTTCMRTGSHTLGAACECGKLVPVPDGEPRCEFDAGSAETAFTVNTTPTVSVSFSGPDALGNGTLSVPFTFPNTGTAGERRLDAFVDGAQAFATFAEEATGTWTPPLNTACWKEGSHEVAVQARACAQSDPTYQDDATTTITVGTKPEVGVSVSGPDVTGLATLTVPFNFENTPGAGSRRIDVFVDGVATFAFTPEEVAGTWTKEIDTSCWRQGAHEITALAVACNKANDPAYRTEATAKVFVDHTPRVGVSLAPEDPKAPSGRQIVTVTFGFPQTLSAAQRRVRVTMEPGGGLVTQFFPEEREGTRTGWVVSCVPGESVWVVAEALACGDVRKEARAKIPDCPEPPRQDRCPEEECDPQCVGPGGGVAVGGSGPGLSGGGFPGLGAGALGPGARLAYLAGGAGSPGNPGQAAWNAILGRNWSHDYAERIVPDPSVAGRAWLITRSASFRRFTDGNGDGLYEAVVPEDEYRTLTKVPSGWELRDLEGSVQSFDSAGLWVRTEDANGNAKVATYSGGRLVGVSMPDGRSETFTYDVAGKLASITEVGVGAAAERAWGYGWSGDDLVTIARPDGTELRFVYGDPRHPGFMTRSHLLGADDGNPATPRPERVLGAWDYDGEGNVVRAWRGAEDFASGVDRYELAYDNPFEPEETTVTIHRSDTEREVVVYTLSRTAQWVGAKPRVTSISGDCPSCGLGPNAQLFYDDPANPLRPTRTVDGRGHETLFTYDANGRIIEKVEAAATTLSRTTSWTYGDPLYPALPTRIEVPSTSGGAALRTTVLDYDAGGNLTSRRQQGVEAGSFFDLETVTTFNAAGQPLVINPPGHGTEDRTSFAYDPARGDLVPLARTEPLVGSTAFEYDAFNRRTAVVDPNGLRTETTYDAVGRVVELRQEGASPAEDLVTAHTYNAFGDLVRTTLPRGNVVEYAYDPAGRLVAVERKPDAATPGERTLYTLDGLGNRVREELQRWDGTAWVTASFTDFVYANRCQVGKVVHADGTATEYAYDCNGNLEKAWDENHPREGAGGGGGSGGGDDCDEPPCEPPGGGPNPPTSVYIYDALDRLIRVTQPWTGPGGGEAITAYAYDAQDHLVAVTDAEGNTTTYQYGDRDLMTREVSPVAGTTTYAYGEDGELVGETDARGVTVTRTVDARGRVILVDSSDPALGTTYTFDDPAVPFATGRLTAIARDGATVSYAYDRFGRLVQDGELSYSLDANGNRTEIGYPGGVVARYGHDMADREASLEIELPFGETVPVVTAAGYEPFGPLSSLALGNGLVESRGFTPRYLPASIDVTADRLKQTYTTDAVGNIRAIGRAVGPDHHVSTYSYQAPQYFLAEGRGPWGNLAWSYDRIGNRLSETPPAREDEDAPPFDVFRYRYEPNPTGGNTPKLSRIEPAPGGEPGSFLDYDFDAAGDQTQVVTVGAECSGRTSFLDYSAERRLARLHTSDGTGTTELTYDGRGFLARSRLTFSDSTDFVQTEPVYSSAGLLLARRFHQQITRGGRGDGGLPPTQPVTKHTTSLFYFAGRPVAQIRRHEVGGSADELLFLTTDHLGVPILATGKAGETVWAGALDPFGTPFVYSAPKPPGDDEPPPPPPGGDGDALQACGPEEPEGLAPTESIGLFLRFPGQWDDPSFHSHGLRGGVYYNLHRWYEAATGRYTRPDPVGLAGKDWTLYSYARANPLFNVDVLGLLPVKPVPDDNADIRRICQSPTALGCTIPTFHVDCTCVCTEGQYRPRPLVTGGPITFYYSTDCYDPQRIIREERRHVREYQDDFNDAVEDAAQFSHERFDSLPECDEACKEWIADTVRDLRSPLAHAWIDFTHPRRRCDGSITW